MHSPYIDKCSRETSSMHSCTLTNVRGGSGGGPWGGGGERGRTSSMHSCTLTNAQGGP